ncbi:methane monooxygenase PmoA-like [Mucilaginibacter gracilis]|uniref:Methane monooxygenase PmoA-like n=1 Tax=Mucilaginibacter gracilis TaxID=423350 RepID=A0A495IVZ9_9SPHI|nr:PmoA family protein [Mucilaginibacter gracilis]RKR80663.1 methane monooxygenase PmoA-like [Mucilaginibacter gracilis]
MWIIVLLFTYHISIAGTIKPDYIKIIAVPTKQRVDITIGGEPFTSLLYADSLKKPTLYPIYTAKQNMVTRGWPLMPKHMDRTDYSHQFGLWFNYGNVNGADYWNNATGADTTKKDYGYIRVQKITGIINGEGKASLTMLSKWYNPGAKAVLEETSVFVFRVERGLRIIDRYITLKALTNVDFKDDKNGMYAFRAATELGQPVTLLENAMLMDNAIKIKTDSIPLTGHLTSSEGIQGESVFAKRAKWMKLTGIVNTEPVTLVMMDNPQNINYPAYWLARSYGLMSINPLGAGVFTRGREKVNFSLAKGKQTTFKYRFVQGGKDVDNDTLEKLFTDFASESL